MRRKILSDKNEDEMDEMNMQMHGFSERFFLQDTNSLKESEFKDLKLREKGWVKEGFCEECGAFDILSKYKGMFLCSKCLRSIKLRNKNTKKGNKSNRTNKNNKK